MAERIADMRISENVKLLKTEFPDFLVLVRMEEMLVAFGPDAIWLTNSVSFIRLHRLPDGTAFAGFPVVLSDVVFAELARAGVDCIVLNAEQAGNVTE
jgi:hypothetical protein